MYPFNLVESIVVFLFCGAKIRLFLPTIVGGGSFFANGESSDTFFIRFKMPIFAPFLGFACQIYSLVFNMDNLDFKNAPLGRLFLRIFFPTLVGMLFNTALNIIDGMFVGHGVGSDALAAINIVAPLFLLCTGLGLMFGIGASVMGSIRLANNDSASARTLMTQAYFVGVIIFTTIIGIVLFATDPVLDIFGCNDYLRPLATDYLVWLTPGLVFMYLQCVGMMLIRLDGSPNYAMVVQIVAAVLNIFLDWLFVFPLGMGLAGASIATSLACIVGGVMVVCYFVFKARTLRFCRISLSSSGVIQMLGNTWTMMKIGAATFISEMTLGMTIVAGNYVFLARLGEAGVAAYSIGCYLFPLLFSINNAVAQAAQPIISYNYGAGNTLRVTRTLRISVVTAIICGLATFTGMWLGADTLGSIFLDAGTPARILAADGLPIMALSTVFFAVNISFIGYYQSTEKVTRSIVYTILRGVIFIIPAFIILPNLIGTPGLWGAIPTAEAITSLIIVVLYAFSIRKRKA